MDISIKINKLPCNHVLLTFTSGTREMKRILTVEELTKLLTPDSLEEVEQMLMGQIRKILVENSTKTLPEIKTIIEGTVFKV